MAKQQIQLSLEQEQEIVPMRRGRKGVIVKALKSLEAIRGGQLSPYDVVEEARSPSSPLHNSFEWDDRKAGDKYRLMQARIMLSTIKVEFQGEKRAAYYNASVQIGGKPTRAYFPIERVMSEEEIHREVLRSAVRELQHAQQKYNSLKEFKGVINTRKLRQLEREAYGV